MSKTNEFDIFSDTSKLKLGQFKIEYPLPWEMDGVKIDPLGYKTPKRVVPEGLNASRDGQSCMYHEDIHFDEKGEELAVCYFSV